MKWFIFQLIATNIYNKFIHLKLKENQLEIRENQTKQVECRIAGSRVLDSVLTLNLECFSDHEYESVFDDLKRTPLYQLKEKFIKCEIPSPNTPFAINAKHYEYFTDELGLSLCRAVEYRPDPVVMSDHQETDLRCLEPTIEEDGHDSIVFNNDNEIHLTDLKDQASKSIENSPVECGNKVVLKTNDCLMKVPKDHTPGKFVIFILKFFVTFL